MPKYVIHKKGFFYTDEAFEVEVGFKGTIVGTFSNLEEAKVAKTKADITSLKKLSGENIVDFFFDHDDFDGLFEKIEAYYKSEFKLAIDDKYYFNFPSNINDTQASYFLALLNLSFHDIVEYADNLVLDPKKFKFPRGGDVGGF